MKNKEKSGLKRATSSWGKFDKNNYIEEIWLLRKMVQKFRSLWFYRKDMEKNGENPLLLYAYGSYGHSMDAYFSSTRLSL
jgi:oligopeptidase B